MTLSRNKITQKLAFLTERYFLPLLLGTVVMNIIFRTYMRFDSGKATALFAVYEILLFFIFEKIKPRKVVRGFVYIGIAAVILLISRRLIAAGYYSTGTGFIDWFYVNSQESGDVREYLYFVFLGFGFFITSILYYFTVYRFRSFGMMLVILFPFVIYGKRDDNISTLSITFMLTVFLALMVHQRQTSDDVKKYAVINSSYAAAVALFVTFTAAVAMVLPKPEYESQLEKNAGIFDMTVNTNTTEYDDLNDESSPRFGANATGEVLFRARSSGDEDIIYFRRQSFDIFTDDSWWLNDDFDMYYSTSDGDDIEVNSPEYLYTLMKKLADTGKYESYGLTAELFAGDPFSDRSWLNLSSTSYSPTYIPAPLMVRTEALTYAYKNYHGETFYDGFEKQYSGLGVSYSYVREDTTVRDYVRSLPLDWESFSKLIEEAYLDGDLTKGQYYNFTKLYSNYTRIDESSPEMEKLAHEITDRYESEYDKAQALVDYFEDNGYIYDLEYEPEDESIEYFLFESKTGSCTSYATSMALMARMVGLPARYVEGFAAYEKAEDGAFIVRDSHAHAFVEVYIAGAGWVTFDPTVPGYMQDYSGGGGGNAGEILSKFMDYFSRIVLFLGVIFVLVFIVLLDRIAELFFRLSLMFKKDLCKKTASLYRRIIRLLELSSGKRFRGYSPRETEEYVRDRREADVSAVVELFEKSCFGGYLPSDVEYRQAYAAYKAAWKALADKKRRKAQKQK
ncbi:MAG: transglutaminase [Ruminococcus sp.]|nr:transglutaminase [Ruminococcus sp.]